MSIGILLAILTSLLSTAQNTMLKLLAKYKKSGSEDKESKKVAKEVDIIMGLITAWSSAFVALLVTLLAAVCFGGFSRIPELPNKFWIAVIEKVPLYVLAVWSYALAHRKGDMSLISPLLAITPAIIIVIAPFLINQKASPLGIAGVFLIVMGAYFLNFHQRKSGLLEPLKRLWKDQGAKFMILTATIYALTSVIDAVGVRTGGNDFTAAILWSVAINLGSVIILAPFAFYFTRKLKNKYGALPQVKEFIGKEGFVKMTLTGFFNGSSEIIQMTAMTYLLAAYVNAIKRFSMVLGVIVGAMIFKEKNIQERLTGSVIMLCGMILIIISAIAK